MPRSSSPPSPMATAPAVSTCRSRAQRSGFRDHDHRSVVRIAAVALGWLAIGGPVRAAVQRKAIGPWSETVEALALDPKNAKTVYAATPNGIFKSTDGAETWVRKSKGIEDIHALCVAIDPKTPATLYVGTYGDGLFKSTDGAETWKAVKPTGGGDVYNLGRYRVKHVAVDPLNPKNLMFTSTHVYKSTTGGATATNVGLGSSTGVDSVTFDPKNPKVVYAAGGDLMKTTDSGATWSRLDFGVPSPVGAQVVAIHPTSGEVLVGSPWGLFKSTDAGSTWKAGGRGLQERARMFAIAWDPTDAANVYVAANLKVGDEASVWHSTDGGATFQDVGKDLPYERVSSLAMDPSNPRVLYAGTTFSGVFKTTDGGATWNEKSVGFESSFRTIRAVAVAGPGTLFATTFGAVYRTTDDGKTWRRLRAGLPKGVDYRFLAAGGADPATITFAGPSRPDREVLNAALRNDGRAFAVAHNHPSGELEPSAADLEATRALAAGAKAVGLRFLDHLIVAGSGWLSLREKGYLS